MGFMEDSTSVQFLTFRLAEETFAVEITKVREVLEFTTVTKVPRVPEFMRGVINLRGSVVPVIDLRLKFGMSKTEKTVDTCVIIVEVEINGSLIHLGAMADSVKEVMDMNTSQIEPPPKIGTRLNTEFMEGMGKVKDDFVMILNIDKIFSSEEMSLLEEAASLSHEVSEATVE